MAGLGKKILSAFVEVAADTQRANDTDRAAAPADNRFAAHFGQLFSEANIPGPDYYEFAAMIGAMKTIADEQSRYYAAFAGLQVQGLDKTRLLSTAAEYLRVLETDASRFHSTVDSTLQEKVRDKEAGVEEKTRRIRALEQEISELKSQVAALQTEIAENKEKIEASTGGYAAESERRKSAIVADIEKIKHYIQ